MKWIVGLVLAVALAGCASGGEAPDESSTSPAVTTTTEDLAAAFEEQEAEASEFCRGEVTEQLTSPGTAEFVDVEVRPFGAESYNVEGSVDSENGFGALLRSEFFCTAKLVEGTWTVDGLMVQ